MKINEYIDYIEHASIYCIEENVSALAFMMRVYETDDSQLIGLINVKKNLNLFEDNITKDLIGKSLQFSNLTTVQTCFLNSIISDIDDLISPIVSHFPVFSMKSMEGEPLSLVA